MEKLEPFYQEYLLDNSGFIRKYTITTLSITSLRFDFPRSNLSFRSIDKFLEDYHLAKRYISIVGTWCSKQDLIPLTDYNGNEIKLFDVVYMTRAVKRDSAHALTHDWWYSTNLVTIPHIVLGYKKNGNGGLHVQGLSPKYKHSTYVMPKDVFKKLRKTTINDLTESELKNYNKIINGWQFKK